MALYRFFQSKERPVIPTLSLAKKEQQKSFWEHGRPQWLHALRPQHKHLVNCRSISYRLAARRSWSSIYLMTTDTVFHFDNLGARYACYSASAHHVHVRGVRDYVILFQATIRQILKSPFKKNCHFAKFKPRQHLYGMRSCITCCKAFQACKILLQDHPILHRLLQSPISCRLLRPPIPC